MQNFTKASVDDKKNRLMHKSLLECAEIRECRCDFGLDHMIQRTKHPLTEGSECSPICKQDDTRRRVSGKLRGSFLGKSLQEHLIENWSYRLFQVQLNKLDKKNLPLKHKQ